MIKVQITDIDVHGEVNVTTKDFEGTIEEFIEEWNEDDFTMDDWVETEGVWTHVSDHSGLVLNVQVV